VACPDCGGEIVVKRGKKKTFYGCSNYPKCKFALWDRPVAETCPACGARFLVEKFKKDGTRELQCRAEGCKYKQPIIDSPQSEKESNRLSA
jgi:DNA topoisomerase-1